MTWFPYRRQAAWNGAGETIEKGVGAVYDVSDTSFATPLTTREVGTPPGSGNGSVMATVAIDGFLSVEFEVEAEEVYWKSGAALPVHLMSAVGMRDATQAAAVSAAAAQDAALAASMLVGAPADVVIAATLADPESETRGAVADLAHTVFVDEFTPRGGVGPVMLEHAGIPLPGSPKSGNLTIGAAYAEIQAYDESNAFPALAKARNGDLVAMWRHAASHVRGFKGDIMLSRSSDLGATWTTPAVALSHATMDYRDPMLTTLSDGRLAVTFFQDDATKADGVLVAFSEDHGTTWGAPVDVPFARAYSNASSGPMVELPNGDLLVCGYGALDSTKDAASRWDVRVMKSTDGGSTWGSSVTIVDGFVADLPYSETVMGLLPDGTTLMALIRCDSATKTIYRATSTDNGATWSAAAAVVTGASGRPSWITLASGGVVLTYRRSSDNSATVATSWDSGATWTSGDLLDGVVAFQSVYQQPVEISAGLVAIVHADEESSVSSRVRFRYLLDGLGFSPLGDARLSTAAAPTTASTVVVGAAGLYAAQLAGPTASTFGGMNRTWDFDAATANYVSGTLTTLPADWATFDIRLVWAPKAATAGNVRWDAQYLYLSDGVTLSNGTATTGATAATSSTTTVRRTTVATALARTAAPLNFRIGRTAADAADTFASAAALLAVEFVKAS